MEPWAWSKTAQLIIFKSDKETAVIYNINDLFVEIDGDLFPACNIQVWPEHPHLHWSDEHKVYYGLYFEMMFEDGCGLVVSQEFAEELADASVKCGDLNHFSVMQTHMKRSFAWHCDSETDLANTLKSVIKQHKEDKGSEIHVDQWVA